MLTCVPEYREAFQSPGDCPGLFSLACQADLETSLRRGNRAVAAQSLPSSTVRQNWDEPLGKTPPPSTGLPPITFRVLHFLMHAGVLLSMDME